MLIVPELEKVFILVPRTGSGSFYREMRRVYPRSMLLYRHMEADGCPRGYDRWERIGFVRHPLARLVSLYTFLQTFGGGAQVQGGQASKDAQRIREQANRPFIDWLRNNDAPFTTPLSPNGDGAYWPVLSRINPLPENKLSQFDYLRPDLGTTIWKFENLRRHMSMLGLDIHQVSNNTRTVEKIGSHRRAHVPLDEGVNEHISTYCRWDLEQDCRYV